MDNCSDDDMAALVKAPRPRQKQAVGQAIPAGHEDWALEHLRGRPLPEAAAIVYVLAYARQRKLFVDVAQDVVEINAIRYRVERAQLRQSGRRGLMPLYWVYAECHASEDAAYARCAEIKAMPHAWQRRVVDRFNPKWLSMANELIAFPCSRDAIGEEGVEMLSECAHAESPTPGRWWIPPVSAQNRANAIWLHAVETFEPAAAAPAPIRTRKRMTGTLGAGVLLLLECLHRLIQPRIRRRPVRSAV